MVLDTLVGPPVLNECRVIGFIRDFSQGHDVTPFLVCATPLSAYHTNCDYFLLATRPRLNATLI